LNLTGRSNKRPSGLVGDGQSASNDTEDTLDALVERYEDEYTSLSVGEFISGLTK
jgi:hypothetical protein